MFNATSMRKMLKRLNMWAAMSDCAIVLVGHLTKKSSSKELYQGLGSIDLVAAARSVIKIEVDEEDENLRTVKHIKSSLTSKGDPLFFGIEDGRVVWEEKSTESKEEKLRELLTVKNANTKQEQAAKYMCELLSKGPCEAVKVEKTLLEKGISQRTIKLAKKLIAVASIRKNNAWYWCLPTMNEQEPIEDEN